MVPQSGELENEAERIFLAGENPRGDGRHTPSYLEFLA
jgi:hypothetical protein